MTTWVELPPPQPPRRIHPAIPGIVRLRDLPNANRPMNTFREEMKTDVFRKTLSVEAEDFFGNLTCHLNRSKPLKVRCREIANLIIQDVKLTNSKRSLKVQRDLIRAEASPEFWNLVPG